MEEDKDSGRLARELMEATSRAWEADPALGERQARVFLARLMTGAEQDAATLAEQAHWAEQAGDDLQAGCLASEARAWALHAQHCRARLTGEIGR